MLTRERASQCQAATQKGTKCNFQTSHLRALLLCVCHSVQWLVVAELPARAPIPYVRKCPAGFNSVCCLCLRHVPAVFAPCSALQRGVQLVATAHGNELQNLVKNPALSDLIGGIQSVTLGECVCLAVWLAVHTQRHHVRSSTHGRNTSALFV